MTWTSLEEAQFTAFDASPASLASLVFLQPLLSNKHSLLPATTPSPSTTPLQSPHPATVIYILSSDCRSIYDGVRHLLFTFKIDFCTHHGCPHCTYPPHLFRYEQWLIHSSLLLLLLRMPWLPLPT